MSRGDYIVEIALHLSLGLFPVAVTDAEMNEAIQYLGRIGVLIPCKAMAMSA